MNFSRTPYVRIYTETSDTGKLLGFFGRALMDALIKAANRAGVLKLSAELTPSTRRKKLQAEEITHAVAVAIGCPDHDFVLKHLPLIMQVGAAETRGPTVLVLPRYHEAQYALIDKSHSSMESERKTRDTREAIENGWIEAPAWWVARERTGT